MLFHVFTDTDSSPVPGFAETASRLAVCAPEKARGSEGFELDHCEGDHWDALHCEADHWDALHCEADHCDGLHCEADHCDADHWDALHCEGDHCEADHWEALNIALLRFGSQFVGSHEDESY